MKQYPQSEKISERSQRNLPGGVVSINRQTKPNIVFQRARGSRMWDADGNEYIDYHAAFGPHVLGHNDPAITEAVTKALQNDASLYGAGTTVLEAEMAELFLECVPYAEKVQFLNTGSEATYQAIRLARAATGRDHIIVMQGGYNGWHNDVACNLMTPLKALGPRAEADEYPFLPISAGIPNGHSNLVHPINFNDLDSVRACLKRYPIACMILEPILQNIGIVHPMPGYLEGLRALADEHGFILIFDEVKTGFRHALGGYATICKVTPDLAVFGKALANGYPMAAVAGKQKLLDLFNDPDPAKRVLLAGTYNGHPVPASATIATMKRLSANQGALFKQMEERTIQLTDGLKAACEKRGITTVVARQGSAFCIYFMDHAPRDWHDIAENHNFAFDEALRRELIDNGVFVFPLGAKQWSVSAAHTAQDIEQTLAIFERALNTLTQN